MSTPDDGKRIEGGFDLSPIMHASEPLTTKDFFALDVDDKFKVELLGGALTLSPSPKPWHGDVGLELRDTLKTALGPAFRIYLDLDVEVDEETVVRPDVFVMRSQSHDPDSVAKAPEVLLAIEIMSPGSRTNDRQVKPALYRDAGIPSWRIERSGQRLLLIEIPVLGKDVLHLGQATLKVAGVDVAVDLDTIARYALGE
jgi:Uma2 family endonuclease